MRHRVLFKACVAMLALLIAGTATAATFFDAETSRGNQFVAGSLDLKIKDNDEPWGDGVHKTWVITNMYPGLVAPCAVEQIEIRNFGSVAGTSIDVACSNTVDDPPGPESDTEEGTTDMDRMIEVMCFLYGDGFPVIDLAPRIVDVNGNGWKDLDDLENSPIRGLPAPTGTGHFQMSYRFRPEADSDYMGDTTYMDLTVTLNQ